MNNSVLFATVSGVCQCSSRYTTTPPPHMSDSSATALAILNTVRASLRLVSCSSELLTIAQLLAVKEDLRETMAIISAQIQFENYGMFFWLFPHVLGDSFKFHRRPQSHYRLV